MLNLMVSTLALLLSVCMLFDFLAILPLVIFVWSSNAIAIRFYRVSSRTSPILSLTSFKGISLGLPCLFSMTHDKVDGFVAHCIFYCPFFYFEFHLTPLLMLIPFYISTVGVISSFEVYMCTISAYVKW
jgi:hypothetical protein